MSTLPPRTAANRLHGNATLAPPRNSDALGHALDAAFEIEPSIPDELAAILSKLDQRQNGAGRR